MVEMASQEKYEHHRLITLYTLSVLMALFPDEPRLVGFIAAEGNGTREVTVTIGAIRRAKLQ